MADISAVVAQLRSMIEPNDADLRESLRVNGWVPQLPAIADEHGVILVGNRRCAFADQLGIERVIQTVTFGKGSDADVSRVRLASVSNIGGVAMTPTDRKRIAEYLYDKEGPHRWTQQAIAKALGVSQALISGDLVNLSVTDKLKPEKTATNPKGAGRPAGSGKKPKKATQLERARKIVEPLIEAGKPMISRAEQDQYGISHAVFDTAKHEAVAKHAAQPAPVDWSTAPGSVQDKIKAAVARERKALEQAFDDRVSERCKEIMEQITLPHLIKTAKSLVAQITNRKGIVTMQMFNRVRFALHPDTYKNLEGAERNVLSQTWEEMKDAVVGEKENPLANKFKLPSSIEELMKMKAAATAAKSAKAKAHKGSKTTPAPL